MKLRQLSLRIRIFLAMIALVLLASVLIAVLTMYQYKEQTDQYNLRRLERKEASVMASIDYWLGSSEHNHRIAGENLAEIFKDKIFEISNIEKSAINFYDLEGILVLSSQTGFVSQAAPLVLAKPLLGRIAEHNDTRFLTTQTADDNRFQSSYSYITDDQQVPIGILNLQYVQDNTAQIRDREAFLIRMAYVYMLMFLLAIALAYFISSYITRSIKAVTHKMSRTRLHTRNEKIFLKNASAEIYTLVNAYNDMVDKLEESATKLAKGEREQAWREMAKQVAHEIKNPLTPMRLTVQSFERKFDPADPGITKKITEFSETLIQQIDTMSAIAAAFSNFANMPAQQRETLEVVSVIKHTLDIFAAPYIDYLPNRQVIHAELDKNQLIRVITNLVKNAIQALEAVEDKKIEVKVLSENGHVKISVSDNGKGISETDQTMIFEPKFTTKTSGMGLGLAIVKNIVEAYNGRIQVVSDLGKGTVFTIVLPLK